jgi:hypothetical protein
VHRAALKLCVATSISTFARPASRDPARRARVHAHPSNDAHLRPARATHHRAKAARRRVAARPRRPRSALFFVLGGSLVARYEVTASALRVDSGSRFDGAREVPLASIREVSQATLRGGRRTRGSALPGYCAGVWTFPDVGEVWLAGDCNPRGLLVRADGEARPIAITPRDPDAFAVAIREHTPRIEALPAPDMSTMHLILTAPIVLVSLTVVFVFMLAWIGPGRMSYVVDGDMLRIRTLFSKSEWPLASLSARVYRPSRMWRVAGTAMPGYYTGRYRSEGTGLRVYATDVERGVLLTGRDNIYVNPSDEPGFFDALREAGVRIHEERRSRY